MRLTQLFVLVGLAALSTLVTLNAQEAPLPDLRCQQTMDPNWRPPMSSPCDPVSLPDHPSTRQFAAWLNVFNAGDPEGIDRFSDSNIYTVLVPSWDLFNRRQRTGGYEIVTIQSAEEYRIDVLLRVRIWEHFVVATMEVGTETPHRINSLRFRFAERPNTIAAPEKYTAQSLSMELDTALAREAASDRFSSAVMIARNGTSVFSAAYGLADREQGVPNTIETKFRIGSMNKMFTAVAVAQLAERDQLSFSDKLIQFLPDYPNPEWAASVTLHQLLTHTGGAGDFFGLEFRAHRLELQSLEDYVDLLGARASEVPDEPEFRYANFGYILLGLVIAEASGVSYYDYVRDNIFMPAGMNGTGSLPENVEVPGRSIGYMRTPEVGWQRNDDTLPYRGTSAGGGYSTVGDLIRLSDALLSHRLLKEESMRELLTAKIAGFRDNYMYAYGFVDGAEEGIHIVGHGGGAPGMSGDLKMVPESGYTIAVLSNFDPPLATDVASYIARRLPIVAIAAQ